jgi:hypothetical protein
VKLDPVELEGDALDMLAACTVAWKAADGGPIIWQGAPLPCNRANARMLYEAIEWVRKPVDEFVADVTVFLDRSETSSESGSVTSSI